MECSECLEHMMLYVQPASHRAASAMLAAPQLAVVRLVITVDGKHHILLGVLPLMNSSCGFGSSGTMSTSKTAERTARRQSVCQLMMSTNHAPAARQINATLRHLTGYDHARDFSAEAASVLRANTSYAVVNHRVQHSPGDGFTAH